MKKLLLVLIIFLIPMTVYGQRGCCSHHGGVCGCSKNGTTICCDNTYSKTCTCTPPTVKGCTDKKAINYNEDANYDNGSCEYKQETTSNPGIIADSYSSNEVSSAISDESRLIEARQVNQKSKENKDDSLSIIIPVILGIIGVGAFNNYYRKT